MEAALRALARSIEGRIVRRGEPDMVLSHKQHAARLPFVEPDVLIRCRSAADVAASVAALTRAGVDFSLRSGGHCFADRSNAHAVIVDCADLADATVSGDRVTVGAGLTAGAAVPILAAHGRAIPTGGCIGVAVSGLAMAGGFGYSGRRLGFLADRVCTLEAVLADGRLVQIDAKHEPDLYWALRGGGAGLVAVTGLTIETAPALGGLSLYGEWPVEYAPELIARWLRWAPGADDAVNVELSLVAPDFLDAPCTIRLHGGAAGAVKHVPGMAAALGAFADDVVTTALPPAAFAEHLVGRRDHRGELAWQPSFPFRDVGFQATRSQFLYRSINPTALAALVARFVEGRRHAQAREVEIIPWGGAYARPVRPACIAHRDAIALIRHTALAGARSTAENRHEALSWMTASHAVLAANGATGAYAGYAELDDPSWMAAAYGSLLPELAAIRQRHRTG